VLRTEHLEYLLEGQLLFCHDVEGGIGAGLDPGLLEHDGGGEGVVGVVGIGVVGHSGFLDGRLDLEEDVMSRKRRMG
jgi:hypothetical protein